MTFLAAKGRIATAIGGGSAWSCHGTLACTPAIHVVHLNTNHALIWTTLGLCHIKIIISKQPASAKLESTDLILTSSLTGVGKHNLRLLRPISQHAICHKCCQTMWQNNATNKHSLRCPRHKPNKTGHEVLTLYPLLLITLKLTSGYSLRMHYFICRLLQQKKRKSQKSLVMICPIQYNLNWKNWYKWQFCAI